MLAIALKPARLRIDNVIMRQGRVADRSMSCSELVSRLMRPRTGKLVSSTTMGRHTLDADGDVRAPTRPHSGVSIWKGALGAVDTLYLGNLGRRGDA